MALFRKTIVITGSEIELFPAIITSFYLKGRQKTFITILLKYCVGTVRIPTRARRIHIKHIKSRINKHTPWKMHKSTRRMKYEVEISKIVSTISIFGCVYSRPSRTLGHLYSRVMARRKRSTSQIDTSFLTLPNSRSWPITIVQTSSHTSASRMYSQCQCRRRHGTDHLVRAGTSNCRY